MRGTHSPPAPFFSGPAIPPRSYIFHKQPYTDASLPSLIPPTSQPRPLCSYITYQQPYTDGGATVSWIGGEEDTTPHTPATSAGGGDERVRSGGAAKQEGVWHVGGQGRLGQILLEEVDAQPADEAFSARGWLDGAVVRGMGGFVGSRRNSEEATRATELMPEQGAADATAPRADLVAISEYLAESNVSGAPHCIVHVALHITPVQALGRKRRGQSVRRGHRSGTIMYSPVVQSCAVYMPSCAASLLPRPYVHALSPA